MTKAPLWTKDFILVSFLNFLTVLVFYLLVVVVGLYASQELGASTSSAGLAVGMFIIGVLAGRLLVGQYIDKVGRKRTLIGGLLFSIVTTSSYLLIDDIITLTLIRFVHGFSIGIAATAMGAAVAFLIPASRRGEGIGYYSMSSTLATAIGPFIGLYMMHNTQFVSVLVLCVAVSVVSFCAGWFLTIPEAAPEQKINHSSSLSLKRFVAPAAVPIGVVILLLSSFYSAVLSFLSAYAIDIDLVKYASFFFIAYSAAVLMSRPFTGRLLDLRGANPIMYPAFIFMVLGFVLLGNTQETWHLLLSGALIGLGYGNLQSCIQALSIKVVEHHEMGLATATFFIFLDAGLGFGPYALGMLVPWLGFAYLFQLCALLTVFCAVGYYFVHGRKVAM